MAVAYYYSSTAPEMRLTSPASAGATAIAVDGVGGLPSNVPFKLVLDSGEVTEEIVKVTGVSGLTLTVVRGWDGTVPTSHALAASARHMFTAEDARLSREHEASLTAHGLTGGAIVGTTDIQVVTNKDLSSVTNTFPASLATDNEVSEAVTSHANASTTHGVEGEIVGTASAQVLTNKDLSSPSNIFPAGTAPTDPGTLENKIISGDSNTFIDIPATAVTAPGAFGDLDFTLSYDLTRTEVSTNRLAAATGWTITQQEARRYGNVVSINFEASRSGATLTSPANGSIGSLVLTLADPYWRPRQDTTFVGPASTGLWWAGRVNILGEFVLTSRFPTVHVTSGDVISGTVVYPVRHFSAI